METIRQYSIIVLLLLAMIATISLSYGRVLVENVQHTVKLMEVEK